MQMRKVSGSSKGNKTFTALLSSSRIKVSGQSVRGRGGETGGEAGKRSWSLLLNGTPETRGSPGQREMPLFTHWRRVFVKYKHFTAVFPQAVPLKLTSSGLVCALGCGGDRRDSLLLLVVLLLVVLFPAETEVMDREADADARRKIQFSVPSSVPTQLDPRQVEMVRSEGVWL